MTEARINVINIDKSGIYIGEKGKYLTLKLIENKGGKDKYGNDGFIVQELLKEQRQAGVKAPIVGNWKRLGSNKPVKRGEDDDIPF